MEKYQTGGDVGTRTGVESSLSPYAGPYVTEMLGRGMALLLCRIKRTWGHYLLALLVYRHKRLED